jgi:hypothetical protein
MRSDVVYPLSAALAAERGFIAGFSRIDSPAG